MILLGTKLARSPLKICSVCAYGSTFTLLDWTVKHLSPSHPVSSCSQRWQICSFFSHILNEVLVKCIGMYRLKFWCIHRLMTMGASADVWGQIDLRSVLHQLHSQRLLFWTNVLAWTNVPAPTSKGRILSHSSQWIIYRVLSVGSFFSF